MGRYSVHLVGESRYQPACRRVRAGDAVALVHEPGNPHDARAIRVDAGGEPIGYLERDSWVTRVLLDDGTPVSAFIEAVIGGEPDRPSLGVLLDLRTAGDAQQGQPAAEQQPAAGAKPGRVVVTEVFTEAPAKGRYPGERPAGWVGVDRLQAVAAGMTTEQRLLLEAQVAAGGPSVGTCYVLWALLGLVSAHRFYLGRPVSALAQIASYFILIGFAWWLIDAFLIPGMIRDMSERRRRDILERVS